MFNSEQITSLTFVGAIAGFIVAFITILNKKAAPITVPIYSLCQGLFLGGVSLMYGQMFEGIVFNVAKRIINSYDIPLKPELDMAARDGFKAMLRLSVKIVATKPPCTLPIGSGNESDSQYLTDHFYPCDDDVIATELGGSIQLESGTNEQ